MLKARGRVAFIIAATSAELPSMCKMLKFGGKSVSASRRLPPSCSVAGSCGLMSLVVPICALCPVSGITSMAGEQPDSSSAIARSAATNRAARCGLSARLDTFARIRLRHRVQQPPGVFVLWIAEDLRAVTLLDDRAGVHHDHLVGKVLDHRKVMGDEQIGQAEERL